jgi:hypothetical protein
LNQITQILADQTISAGKARAVALEHLNASRLLTALMQVSDLASPAENLEVEIWESAHRSISSFIIPLLTTIKFEGGTAVVGLLEAIKFLKRTTGTARNTWGEIPQAFIPKNWRTTIFPTVPVGTDDSSNSGHPTETFKRHKYVVCVAHQLHAALKRGDIFGRHSNNHDDPRAKMLTVEAWQEAKAGVLRSLGLSENVEQMIKRWSRQLDVTYGWVSEHLKENPNLTFESKNGNVVPVITPFEALPESPTLIALNKNIESRLPEIALTELALEIDARVGFAEEMLLVSDSQPIAKDLRKSVVAVLVAETCTRYDS